MKLSQKSRKSRSIGALIAIFAAMGLIFAPAQIASAAPMSSSVSTLQSSAASHPVLHYGAHSSSVKTAQRALNKHGASLAVDGVFGPATLRAVKSFQRSHGLVIDGIVGPKTWGALGSGGTPTPTPPKSPVKHVSHPTLRYGAHGSAVKTMQRALKSHGISVSVDGAFGPASLRAVRSLQSRYGLIVDGVVGPRTWTALELPNTVPASKAARSHGITRAAINAAAVYGSSIDINRSTNTLYFLRYFSGSVHVSRSATVSFAGCNSDGCFTTPSGAFHVVRKAGAGERSKQWHNAPMPWPVYFTWSGYAVHQDPLGPSHGCIHIVSITTMRFINQHTPIGALVMIHW